MALARHYIRVVDENGQLVSGATVEVRHEAPGMPLAQLFSDRDGATADGIPNPFNALTAPEVFPDSSLCFFHVEGDAYQITVTAGDLTEVRNFVAIGTNAETDTVGGVGSFSSLTVVTLTVTGIQTNTSTSHMGFPGGTTAQRPGVPADKNIRINTDTGLLEFYLGGWVTLGQQIVPPQGRLSLVSGTPVIGTNQLAKTDVFFMPHGGNTVFIWDGSRFVAWTFSQLTLALLAASQIAGGIYDIFAAIVGGAVVIGTGPIWSAGAVAGSVAAGAGARGTGAGSTELEVVNGLKVNKVSIVLKNGATTHPATAARQATYLGSLYSSTAGQVTCHVDYGLARLWEIWNAHNQKKILLRSGDSTGSWTPGTTLGPVNVNANNKATPFCGLPEDWVKATYRQSCSAFSQIGSGSSTRSVALGLNSTTVASGKTGQAINNHNDVNTFNMPDDLEAFLALPPGMGINNLQMLEAVTAGAKTHTGGQSNCEMITEWLG